MTNINIKNLFISNIIIQRQVNKRDNYGGLSGEYKTIEKTVGRISTTGGSISNRFNTRQDVGDVRYKLFCSPGTNIQRNDRIISEGKIFNVASVIEPSYASSRNLQHHLECFLIEVQPEIKIGISFDNFSAISGEITIREPDFIFGFTDNFSDMDSLLQRVRMFIPEMTSSSEFSAILVLDIPIFTEIENNSFQDGNLRINRFASSIEEIESFITSDMKRIRGLLSLGEVNSLISGNLELEAEMGGLILNDAAIYADMVIDFALTGDILNDSEIAASLNLEFNIESLILNESVNAADLNILHQFIGFLNTDSEISSEIKRARSITGEKENNSILDSVLKLDKTLISDVLNESEFAGLTAINRNLSTNILNESVIDFILLSILKSIVTDLENETQLNLTIDVLRKLVTQLDNETFLETIAKINKKIEGRQENISQKEAELLLFRGLISEVENESLLIGDLIIDVPEIIFITGIILNSSDLDSLLSLSFEISGEVFEESRLEGNAKRFLGLLAEIEENSLKEASVILDRKIKTEIINISENAGDLKLDMIIRSVLLGQSVKLADLKLNKFISSEILEQSFKEGELKLNKFISSQLIENTLKSADLSIDKNIIGEILLNSTLEVLIKMFRGLKTNIENESLKEGVIKAVRGLETNVFNQSDFIVFVTAIKGLITEKLNESDISGIAKRDRKIISEILVNSNLECFVKLFKNIETIVKNDSLLEVFLKIFRNIQTEILNETNIETVLSVLKTFASDIDSLTFLNDTELKLLKGMETEKASTTSLIGNLTDVVIVDGFTDFGEYTLNEAPDDWTERFTSNNDYFWEVISNTGAEEFVFSDQILRLSGELTDTFLEHSFLGWNVIPDDAKNIRMEGLLSQPESVNNGRMGFAFRASGTTGSENLYTGNIQQQGSDVRFVKYINGTPTIISSVSPEINIEIAVYYYFKAEIIDNQFKFKVWEYGTNEIDYWNIVEYDDEFLEGGFAGLWGEVRSNDVYFDTFEFLMDPPIETTITTNFNEYPIGENPQDWLVIFDDDPDNIVWSVVDDGSTTNNILQADIQGPVLEGNGSTNWIKQIPPDTRNVRLKGRMKVGQGGDFDAVGFSIRASDDTAANQTLYRMRLTPDLSPDNSVVVNRVINGANEQTYSAPEDITINFNTWYWVVFQMIDTELKVKVWEDGTAEPETWDIEASDTGIIAGGRAGASFTKFVAGANIGEFDDVTFEILDEEPIGTFFTDYSEYTTGQQPSDWATRWDEVDVTWEVQDDVNATGGKLLNYSSISNGFYMLSWNDLDAINDIEVTIKARSDSTTSTVLGILLRSSFPGNEKNGYLFDLNGGNRARLVKWVNDTLTVINEITFNFSINTWYWLTFRLQNNELKAKVWADGDAEPAAWDLEETDNDITSGNWNGVFSFSENISTDYDVYDVTNLS